MDLLLESKKLVFKEEKELAWESHQAAPRTVAAQVRLPLESVHCTVFLCNNPQEARGRAETHSLPRVQQCPGWSGGPFLFSWHQHSFIYSTQNARSQVINKTATAIDSTLWWKT